ncbi:MAG TPA: hypothetical protein VE709_10185 [Pseudonocardiaceae bacterium]|nr:hypothetical protein [Pseudonocardiaceae bacterium]
MPEASFVELGGGLGALGGQQSELQAAVESGQLWMESDVAKRAATRCERAAGELDDWLVDTDELVQRRKFGANEDGEAAAARFAAAGREYVQVIADAQSVFLRMAETYRAAGRTMERAEQAGHQTFGGGQS